MRKTRTAKGKARRSLSRCSSSGHTCRLTSVANLQREGAQRSHARSQDSLRAPRVLFEVFRSSTKGLRLVLLQTYAKRHQKRDQEVCLRSHGIRAEEAGLLAEDGLDELEAHGGRHRGAL